MIISPHSCKTLSFPIGLIHIVSLLLHRRQTRFYFSHFHSKVSWRPGRLSKLSQVTHLRIQPSPLDSKPQILYPRTHWFYWKVPLAGTQLCPTLCDPMDCSPSSSSVHGIFQARILEWIAISFSRQLLYLYWLQSSSTASLRNLRNFLEPCNELFSPTMQKDTLQRFRNMVGNKAFPVTVYCLLQ